MAGVLATVLGLAGCASPNPAPMESALASAPGISAAEIVIGHPGVPWNTQALITLHVADDSAATVEAAAKAAVPKLADTEFANHDAAISFVVDAPAGSKPPHTHVKSDVLKQVAETLGLRSTRYMEYLSFRSDDIRRIAAEQ